jgi:hypothetical protein
MNRTPVDVGAFSWARIQRLHDAESIVHWQRCEAEGLQCPQEVFAQLFHDKANDEGFAVIARSIDWGGYTDVAADSTSPEGGPESRLWAAGAGRAPGRANSPARRGISWELQEMSGVALRHMRVDRGYQHALDEARDRATQFGIMDDREEVVRHWQEAKSWIVPPVAITGELIGGGTGYELLVGFTRLGNLLGLLDREEVKEVQKHLVWVGRGAQ